MLLWQLVSILGIPLCLGRTHCTVAAAALQDHTALLQMTMRNFQRGHDEAHAEPHAQTIDQQPRHGPHKSADHRPRGFGSLALVGRLRNTLASAVHMENHLAGSGKALSVGTWLFIGFALVMVGGGLVILCISPKVPDKGSEKKAKPLEKQTSPGEARATSLMRLLHVGNPSFRIPMSSYGSAMILPILLQPSTFMEWIQTDGKCYMRLTLNYLIQIPMVYGLKLISEEDQGLIKSGDCDKTSPALVYAGLFVFVCAAVADIEETIDITDIAWNLIPTTEKSRTLLYVEDDEDELEFVDGGFSFTRKLGIMIFIIVPKLLIALAVLAYGSLFLAASTSNADVLLNALALIFIVEIDELIFSSFAPRKLAAVMEALPEFEYKSGDSLSKQLRQWGFQMKLVFCIVFVWLFYFLSPACGVDSLLVDVEDIPRGFHSWGKT
mmetsp:Transcript_57841/g.103475  ORF Transcript_57841/g.103475 Transcript_57841/m.103475 type:complete len:438 (+) Transcript_57841:69-1382(+)